MWIYRLRKGGLGVGRKWEGEEKEEEEGPRVIRSEDECAGGLSLVFFLCERVMEVDEWIVSFKGVGLSLNVFSLLLFELTVSAGCPVGWHPLRCCVTGRGARVKRQA